MAEPLTRGQREFAGTFARETGLNPRVVGAWLKAEQSGSAAENYERRGYHNWLNIAQTDTGPASGAHSSVWRNPHSAGKAAAEWMMGRGQIAREYGKPAPGIMGILHTRGQSPENQIKAIAGSGWASSGYEHGNTLRQLYGELGGVHFNLGAAAAAGVPMSEVSTTAGTPERVETRNIPKPLNPFEALMKIQSGDIEPGTTEAAIQKNWEDMSTLFDKENPIRQEVIRTPGTAPESTRVTMPGAIQSGGKLGGFIPGNAPLTYKRIDEGQDGYTTPGGPMLAPGDGVVVAVPSDPGGFGPRYPVIRFTTGRLAGHEVYVGHTLSVVQVGQHVHAGQIISHTGFGHGVGNATVPGWFEIGFWPPGAKGGMEAGRAIAPYLK